jgi:guanylate kinase
MSSPSGAGKTTLTQDLLAHFPDLMFSVSHTTRKPRASEVHGRDYHFVDPTTFKNEITEDAFAEWAEVHGNLYGTSFREIDRCQQLGLRGIVFDIDYQGARQIKARCPDAVGVFVLPPSMDELKRRLRGRASDDESAIERRFANAKREVEHYGLFDYLIVNDDLEQAKHRLRSIVLAERSRRWRMAGPAEQMLRRARGD